MKIIHLSQILDEIMPFDIDKQGFSIRRIRLI